MGRLPKSWN